MMSDSRQTVTLLSKASLDLDVLVLACSLMLSFRFHHTVDLACDFLLKGLDPQGKLPSSVLT